MPATKKRADGMREEDIKKKKKETRRVRPERFAYAQRFDHRTTFAGRRSPDGCPREGAAVAAAAPAAAATSTPLIDIAHLPPRPPSSATICHGG